MVSRRGVPGTNEDPLFDAWTFDLDNDTDEIKAFVDWEAATEEDEEDEDDEEEEEEEDEDEEDEEEDDGDKNREDDDDVDAEIETFPAASFVLGAGGVKASDSLKT